MGVSRRFLGLVRTSLTGGVVMSVFATGALALGLATGLVPSAFFGARELIAVAIRGFGAGAVAGGLFAWLVTRGTKGQQSPVLSTRRVALWGGLATVGVFLLAALAAPGIVPIGVLATGGVVAGLGGSAVSAAMLKLARRTPQPLERLDARTDHLLP